jgi:hypothetical protein
MAIILSDDVLTQTTKCEMDFACLSNRTDHLCKVERLIGFGSKPVLFLRQGEEPYCHYNFGFGTSIICSCPVRLELYKRYGI